ncbi:sodium/hydrogen exchanger 9B2-like [Ornithorhynchus anatinus]|uniref:sodium/hydrogen exchanger 9B2-like n=1 Tax=Ornithorhynchus anatinus TaxID=9258 RepID=UPI0010A80219|nr:sodium/hydrogen exchanger 9B2-like [Ornithorhynchus anatinus]
MGNEDSPADGESPESVTAAGNQIIPLNPKSQPHVWMHGKGQLLPGQVECSGCQRRGQPQGQNTEDLAVDPKDRDKNEEVEETVLLKYPGPQPPRPPTKAEFPRKWKYLFSCPPKGKFDEMITKSTMIILIWAIAWCITGKEALPGGNLFGLLLLLYFAILGGKILEFIKLPSIPPLPPLLGMLLAGFLIRNIPFVSQQVQVSHTWSSYLRNIALTIILAQAGLGLDPQALKKLKTVCFRLSLGPCLIEACSAAVISHFLMHFPWQWGFVMGFVLGAVSPAIVVPTMLFLQDQGYGVDKGIPTLLIAASSFDDILAITGFNTCLSMAFSTGSMVDSIFRGLGEAALGVVVGGLLGCFIRYFPSSDQEKLEWKRAYLILGLCVFVVLSSNRIGLHGSGGLCTLVLTFIAGLNWAKEKERVQKIVAGAWKVFQPLLFGLVGAEISVASLTPGIIGICVTTLSLAVVVRIFITFQMVSFAGFNIKEKIFISLAWIPKATVQAVLGPLALETARASNKSQLEEPAKTVMTVAFLAILITAPNGALLIGLLGSKLLKKKEKGLNEENIEEGELPVEGH